MSEGSEGDGLVGFLEYVRRPPGDGHTLITAAGAWERAANGIRESLDRLDRKLRGLWDPTGTPGTPACCSGGGRTCAATAGRPSSISAASRTSSRPSAVRSDRKSVV